MLGGVDPQDISILRRILNWIVRFRIVGDGVSFKNSLDGCTVQISWPPREVAERLSDKFCFAKLTSQDATNKWWYNWSEAEFSGSGWSIKSGGRSGTTSGDGADPAVLTDSTATWDISTNDQPYVLLVRPQNGGGWVIVSPFGFTGDSQRWGQVLWDGTTLSQNSTTAKYVIGMLQATPANDPTTIDTPTDCG